ncbi:RING-type domain-containing protein [Aphelenchoides bicaudatus]|nr:RING-type domain-containing protein [Aphelenchoides bicaudatus]
MNGMAGSSTSETITGQKTLELSEYDKVRKPHKVLDDETMITISSRTLTTEICCPICLDLFTGTMGTKECLHRFCSECINTALLRNNKECPTCRKKIVSKRSLRSDTNMDALLTKIWPERRLYDEMQSEANNYYQTNNVIPLQRSIEAGIKAQAQNRRQRIQGSYDYEKRKRRRRLPDGEQEVTAPNSPSDATPPINGENGDSQDANSAGDSSSIDSLSSESSSNLSTTISDTSDLDSSSSDEEVTANGPSTSQNSAPPSLENMTSASPFDENTMDAIDRGTYVAKLMKYQEVEIELVPSKSLCQRSDIPAPLKKSRFIKSHRNTTMEHLSEYLLQTCRADLTELEAKGQPTSSTVPTPTFFFAFDTDGKLYSVPLPEILREIHASAPPSTEHLRLFYDVDSYDENKLDKFVLTAPPISNDFDEEMSDD